VRRKSSKPKASKSKQILLRFMKATKEFEAALQNQKGAKDIWEEVQHLSEDPKQPAYVQEMSMIMARGHQAARRDVPIGDALDQEITRRKKMQDRDQGKA